MNERGFFLPALPIAAWGAIAAGVVIVGLGIALKIQSTRLDSVKAEYATFRANIEAAKKVHDAEDKRKESESAAIITQKDTEYERNALVISAAWKSYADSLRVKPGGSSASQGPKPDQAITSIACNDPAKDALVSAAIEGARREVRSAITEYRIGIAGLFEQADKQAEQLITLQAEVAELARVNQ